MKQQIQIQLKIKTIMIWGIFFSQATLALNQPDDHLYFKNIYYSRFTSIEQAEKAKQEDESNLDLLLEYANFYYTTGAQMPLKDKTGIEYINKAFIVYQTIWKKKLSEPSIQIMMANAYASQAGVNPKINLATLIEYVFRARNLYSMVVDRYPQNLEARLGRARINMNLTAMTGRPDAIHREDIRAYIEGYQKLPQNLAENPYYKNGLMEMYLAQAMLDVEKKEWNEVKKNINKIDTKLLHEQALKLYNGVLKELNHITEGKK